MEKRRKPGILASRIFDGPGFDDSLDIWFSGDLLERVDRLARAHGWSRDDVIRSALNLGLTLKERVHLHESNRQSKVVADTDAADHELQAVMDALLADALEDAELNTIADARAESTANQVALDDLHKEGSDVSHEK